MSHILKGFSGFHLSSIPLLKPSGGPKANIIPVQFGSIEDTYTPTPHKPFQRIFIDAPGFERNEEWAQTMWGLAENASKNLETRKFKTAYEVLDSFSKAYQKFTGKGEWFNLPHSGRPPWELSKISGPGTKQTSILRRGPFLERIKAMAQSGLHGQCALDKAKEMDLYLYNYKTIDHLHFQQQDGI
ncbi:MAG: hypothetical protein K2X66_02425, partial [Cyanobacteria bacterium]|nr:hypothetical protein [Cyanobacteriota bacterium]